MELSYTPVIPHGFLGTFDENVWCDGQLVRTSYNVAQDTAQPLIQELISEFPHLTEEYLKSNPSNQIGVASNYRLPYTNGCMSWYTWGYLTEEIIDKYNVNVSSDWELKPWHGFKFDFETKHVWLKVVFRDKTSLLPTPDIPNKNCYYALIYDESGNVDDLIDVYFKADYDDMRQFCLEHDVSYPEPESIEGKTATLFSVVYNKDTLDVDTVKAYIVNYERQFK